MLNQPVSPIAAVFYSAFVVCLITVGCGGPVDGPTSLDLEGVPNLSQDDSIYVSGCPTSQGLEALKARGVKTVIDLRQNHQRSEEYPEAVRKLGLNYVHLPMSSDAMTEEQADDYLDAIRRYGDQPILNHCGSANRSGAMHGLYLATERGCSIDEAVRRARRAGMRNEGLARDLRNILEARAQSKDE